MAAMTSTGITCLCCGETLSIAVKVTGQERQDDGTVHMLVRAELTGAHIESHRP